MQQIRTATASGDASAVEAAMASIDALPKPARGSRKAARQANDAGLAAMKAGNHLEAIAAFERGLAADPADSEIIGNLSYAYLKNGQWAAARAKAIVAVRVAPRLAFAWNQIATADAQLGADWLSVRDYVTLHQLSTDRAKTRDFLTKTAAEGDSPAARDGAALALGLHPCRRRNRQVTPTSTFASRGKNRMSAYLINRDGVEFGPYADDEAKAFFKSGNIAATDLVWKEGMAAWKLAGEIFGFSASPPPAMSAAAPPLVAPAIAPVAAAPAAPQAVAASGKRQPDYTNAQGESLESWKGFSWPTLFFGPSWFVYKGMGWWAIFAFVIQTVSLGMGQVVLAFFSNGLHAKWLTSKGYVQGGVIAATARKRPASAWGGLSTGALVCILIAISVAIGIANASKGGSGFGTDNTMKNEARDVLDDYILAKGKGICDTYEGATWGNLRYGTASHGGGKRVPAITGSYTGVCNTPIMGNDRREQQTYWFYITRDPSSGNRRGSILLDNPAAIQRGLDTYNFIETR